MNIPKFKLGGGETSNQLLQRVLNELKKNKIPILSLKELEKFRNQLNQK